MSRPQILRFAAVGALAVTGVWVGGRLDPVSKETATTPPPPIEVGSLRDAGGARARVEEVGARRVVMLSSTSCGYCKEALRDMASRAGGRTADGLWLVTLEGADASRGMLQEAGVRGGRALGPADGATQALLTFQTPGTPVFALLDSTGRIIRAVSGYPGARRMEAWFDEILSQRP